MGIFTRIMGALNKKIDDPTIGYLNLVGADAVNLINEDKLSFGDFFSNSVESDTDIPECDVLMLYCHVKSGGALNDKSLSLVDVVRKSGAIVVIIANENDADSYMRIANNSSKGINIVMTLNRKGENFTKFFARLFEMMAKGTTMPMAWHKLAPQIPGQEHKELPDTIFFCGAGQISFNFRKRQ